MLVGMIMFLAALLPANTPKILDVPLNQPLFDARLPGNPDVMDDGKPVPFEVLVPVVEEQAGLKAQAIVENLADQIDISEMWYLAQNGFFPPQALPSLAGPNARKNFAILRRTQQTPQEFFSGVCVWKPRVRPKQSRI